MRNRKIELAQNRKIINADSNEKFYWLIKMVIKINDNEIYKINDVIILYSALLNRYYR